MQVETNPKIGNIDILFEFKRHAKYWYEMEREPDMMLSMKTWKQKIR